MFERVFGFENSLAKVANLNISFVYISTFLLSLFEFNTSMLLGLDNYADDASAYNMNTKGWSSLIYGSMDVVSADSGISRRKLSIDNFLKVFLEYVSWTAH